MRFCYAFGHKKLSDAFIDNRVPYCIRDHLPVVLCGREPIWAPGLRVAARCAPGPDAPQLRIDVLTDKAKDGGV